jgi:hypothetical protein
MPNSNRDKGNKTERNVAAYFRAAGITTAERRVVAGWHRTDRSDPDLGDIKDVPGICIQVKNLDKTARGNLSGRALAVVLAATEAQRDASGEPIGLLIEKRPNNATVGSWWAHLPANVFVALVGGLDPWTGPHAEHVFPIRVELRHITDHLVRFSRLCEQGIEAA